jgi:hypothetical protein
MTTKPDPSSSAAIPISHSSDKNAPVKAIGDVVLAGCVVPVGGMVIVGGPAVPGTPVPGTGVVTGGLAVTLPGTYVMV